MDGFENGAFSGAIAGIISGGMGFGLSAGGKAALGLGKTMLIGAASGLGSSLISDLGDILIKGEDISLGEVFFNAAFSGAFAGASYGFSKAFGSLLKNSSWLSKAKELFRIGKTSNANYGKITSYTTTNPKGISINFQVIILSHLELNLTCQDIYIIIFLLCLEVKLMFLYLQ